MRKLPVLLLNFNRPDLTASVLEAVLNYRPSALYLACDGPRPGVQSDSDRTAEVRRTLNVVDSGVTTNYSFSDENLGPQLAVTQAIDWFFGFEDEGIILEDDFLPNSGFFLFCEEVIERYRDSRNVWGCGGFNPSQIRFTDASYGFINFAHMSGGWATWANRWFRHDRNLDMFRSIPRARRRALWPSRAMYHGFDWNLRRALRRPPRFWDYQLMWSVAKENGLWAVSSHNLGLNLGFREDATHGKRNPWPSASCENAGELKHPVSLVKSEAQENLFLRRHYRVYRPHWLNYFRNGVRWLKLFAERVNR